MAVNSLVDVISYETQGNTAAQVDTARSALAYGVYIATVLHCQHIRSSLHCVHTSVAKRGVIND
jgi:hypothetical protein